MIQPCGAEGLTSWDQVSCYCERALDPDFWAEPLNAMSNLAFLFAAALVYTDLRVSGLKRGSRTILGLIGLLIAVGVGSFLFHTYATGWARLADVAPIAAFVAVYIAVALRWFLNMSLAPACLISGLLVGLTVGMFLCGGPIPAGLCAFLGSSLNGSLAYAPALAALLIVGILLHRRRHGATDWVLSAMCVFALSLVLRTIDGWPAAAPLGCMVREMGGQTIAIGTHSLWHILNAVTLYLLLRALIENPPATGKF
ncbi:ceramidase [bacterium BMS3Bbin10]|nr:ceramidase [bacterium BMS3Bbin10]